MAPLPTHRDREILAEIEQIMTEFSSDQLIKAAHALATQGVKTAHMSYGGPAQVRSFQRPSVWYRTTAQACSCDAHVLCWHIAAVRIRALLPVVDEMASYSDHRPHHEAEDRS